MSEIAGQQTDRIHRAGLRIDQAGHRAAATDIVHESYSFACMRCGQGWEQSYEIEHHIDGEGREFVMYVVDGGVVPSPLSRPTCEKCDSHVVRIMRAGQVASVLGAARRRSPQAPQAGPVEASGSPGASVAAESPTGTAGTPDGERHHWHLSDLLHPFHRRAS
ncbi:hypothetical protein ABZ354_07940 [Streptomyces sp. NPDC005925]|uniref:hypothetical protein n=1 Tax=Streptomyces sp. NPDC005925 TaxID=3157172 RepID=UPI0033C64987